MERFIGGRRQPVESRGEGLPRQLYLRECRTLKESPKKGPEGDPAALFDTVASRIHNQGFAQTQLANRSFNLLQVAYDDDHCIVWTQVPAGSRVCLIQGDLLDRLGILLNIFQRQAKRDQIDDLIDQASKSFKTLREAANEIRLG